MEISENKQLQSILEVVSEITEVSILDIIGRTRKREASDARKLFFAIAANPETRTQSLQAIGGFINRDHATALYNERLSRDLSLTDKQFKKTLDMVKARVDPMLKSKMYDNQFTCMAQL